MTYIVLHLLKECVLTGSDNVVWYESFVCAIFEHESFFKMAAKWLKLTKTAVLHCKYQWNNCNMYRNVFVLNLVVVLMGL